MTRRSRSKTSTGTLRRGNQSNAPFSMVRNKSLCRRSFPRWRSLLSLFLSSSSLARRSISLLLSRTLVPVMVKYLIRSHEGEKPKRNLFMRIQQSFEKHFENFRQGYVDALAWSLQNRATVFALFGLLVGSAFVILSVVGRDFFPTVDAGQFRLHVNAPSGTRLEQSEQVFSRVEDAIREVVPPHDLDL